MSRSCVGLAMLVLVTSLGACGPSPGAEGLPPVSGTRLSEHSPPQVDVAALIDIADAEQAAEKRARLIRTLFGDGGLPRMRPAAVHELRELPERYAHLEALQRVEEVLVQMDFGLESRAHHFIPHQRGDSVVLYHQGHAGGFELGLGTIARLLDAGHSVLAFAMPLIGGNNQPVAQTARFGPIKLDTHAKLRLLAPSAGHPVRYFVEPVVVALNHLQDDHDYASVAMVGLSGGGWTTTMAAAIDTRIQKSFPVAGSYPVYLRALQARDWGDDEQTEPAILRVANHLELYVLGSIGWGRKQLQIINFYDPCCFAGDGWKSYLGVVENRARSIDPGAFDLYLDDSHREHKISGAAVEKILEVLAAG